VLEEHRILSITALEATMSQLAEAIETYTYVITGLSEHTRNFCQSGCISQALSPFSLIYPPAYFLAMEE
jgi:hypothetical protein